MLVKKSCVLLCGREGRIALASINLIDFGTLLEVNRLSARKKLKMRGRTVPAIARERGKWRTERRRVVSMLLGNQSALDIECLLPTS